MESDAHVEDAVLDSDVRSWFIDRWESGQWCLEVCGRLVF
jgi:hypothetical protein